MEKSPKAEEILSKLISENTRLSDVRKLAKEINKDHPLALELWATGNFFARQLAILILDPKSVSETDLDHLFDDIDAHQGTERLQLIDWLMANQLVRSKRLLTLISQWANSRSPLKRRVYWYHQARLRWTGKIQPDSEMLLNDLEAKIEGEVPEVQWAMNFTAAWIGVFEKDLRQRCIRLGEKTGLFQGQKVPKGCTPDYLPEFIRIESQKRNL